MTAIRRRHLRIVVAVVSTAIIVGASAPSSADDRDLLDGWRAKPNVLLILDSGSAMAHDSPTSSIHFPAGADDDGRYAAHVERMYGAAALRDTLGPDFRPILQRGSKLYQAKAALSSLLERGARLNLGFTFFEHQDQNVGRLAFIYRVVEGQLPMLDGSQAGDPIRMGPTHSGGLEVDHERPYSLRYGADGEEIFVARIDPLGSNRGTGDQPEDGDIRLVSFLVDGAAVNGARSWRDIPLDERKARHLFYHPAYDFDALPDDGWIRSGLLGSTSWRDVAVHLGIQITSDQWQKELRSQVVAEIEHHSIGTQQVSVMERYEIYKSGMGWLETRPSDCSACPRQRVSELIYSQHFVVAAPDDDGDQLRLNEQLSQCLGFVNGDDAISPVVGFPVPDPISGGTADNRSIIRNFLEPQSTPMFFFPTRSVDQILPIDRENFLPLTDAVVARGDRPLAASLREAADYFEHSVGGWDDPSSGCRDNFIIVVTDGAESCEDPMASCSAAADLGDIPVYILVLGGDPMLGSDPSLDCIAATTGGRVYGVDGGAEIGAAVDDIVGDVDKRSRGFSAIAFPPGANQQQQAFVANFAPHRGRSIWQGHVVAYAIDPVVEIVDGGSVESFRKLWDAGDILASRWDWGDLLTPNPFGASVDPRSMYYGVSDDGSGSRGVLAFPGNQSRHFDQRFELGRLIYGRWPESIEGETNEGRSRLRNDIDFVRGVSVSVDREGLPLILRDPELYGWCGMAGSPCGPGEQPQGFEKLGDIFHSDPEVMAYPSCTACYWTDLHGYKDFFTRFRHRRSVLFVGANDGALHAFDAGLWDPSTDDVRGPRYDGGSGRELFAWIPQSVMKTLPLLAATSNHRWTVDGSPSIADVWIDPDGSAGNDREWRTMLLWGQRRGGRSYVCLDVTQPDPVDQNGDPSPVGQAAGSVPSPSILRQAGCQDSSDGTDGCPRLWPQFRWEFTDDADDDNNGAPDLGLTWSRPVVGFIRVIHGGNVEERMVAFFGGGLAEGFSIEETDRASGNFIYGLDIETGKVLFKAVVQGMVPGDVQLLDLNSDGFVEKALFGTTAGMVYSISMEEPGVLGTSTGRIETWRPEVIFSAGPDQPFFMRPTLVPAFVNAQGGVQLAVLVGSGNRDNLLERNGSPHRFYAFLMPESGPLVEDDLVEIEAGSASLGVSLLAAPQTHGWFITMDSTSHADGSEKVVTPAFAFDNAVVFSTFDPGDGEGQDGCGSRGVARSYVVNLVNGDPLPGKPRYVEHPAPTTFVGGTQLFVAADGTLRTIQVGDHLKIHQPLQAVRASVELADWKEE